MPAALLSSQPCLCTDILILSVFVLYLHCICAIHNARAKHLSCVCCSSNSTILALSLSFFHQILIFNYSVTFHHHHHRDHLAIAINMDLNNRLYFQSVNNSFHTSLLFYLFELLFKGSGPGLEGGSWAAGVSTRWGGRQAGQGAGGALRAHAAQAARGRQP